MKIQSVMKKIDMPIDKISKLTDDKPKHSFWKTLSVIALFTLFFLLAGQASKAATYYSIANAAWNVNSTWSTTGYGGLAATAFPVAGDIVNIGNNKTVTVSANAACASITIDATGTLIQATTRTVNATTGITINGTYTNQSSGAITTPSWVCNGTYTHAGASATLPKGATTTTWAAASNLNITRAFTSATVLTNFIGQTFGNVTFNPSSMTNTVCLFGASGSVTVQGNFTITTTGSSTLYMRQSGQQFVGVLNINGNMTITAGKLDMHNGGPTPTTSTINLKGNLTLSGTSTLTQTTTQSGSTVSFNFTGTTTQVVTISPTAIISSQGTTASCAIQFTVASGSTIDMGTSVLTGTNNTSFTMSPGSGIITANTEGLSTSGATGSIQVNGPRIYSTTGNYTYNSTVAGQITGNGLTAANNLTISNTTSSGVTFSNSIAISGNMSVTTGAHVNLGTFTSSAASLTLGGVTQANGTSYGGTGSLTAEHINTTYFNNATGTLAVSLPAPSNLSYTSPFAFPLNVAITQKDPTVTGVVTTWSISPGLPTGLSFNTSTGAITGTPTVGTPSASYTVTATNATGSTNFIIVMSVGNYRYAVASADWNLNSTWAATSGGTAGASFPVSGDIVFIGEALINRTVTIPTGISAACGSLTMGNYSAATVATLTFTDATSLLAVDNDLIMNRPNAAATTVINVNTGSLTVGGTLKLANSDLTPNAGATLINRVNISTGTVTTANLMFNGQAAAQSQLVFSGAGTLNISGNLTFGYILGTLTPSTGTVNFNGTAIAQTIPIGVSAVTYYNLKINNTNAAGATINAAITGTNVTGDLTVGIPTSNSMFNNGGYAITLASAKNLNIASGSTFNLSGTSSMVTVSGGGTKTFGATSTVNYNGSSQTVTVETYGHLTLSGFGNKTLPASTITVAGNFSMSGTATTTALAAINTAGNFTLGSGTTFNASTFTHTVGGDWTNGGAFTPSTGTIEFNGTGAGNIGTSSFKNVTFSGAGTKTAVGALTIAGNVSITNNFAGGSYNHSVAGNWANSGTFTPNTSTITFNGTTAQSINNASSSFYDFEIFNTGATCTALSNITVDGTFSTLAGTTLNMATYALSTASVNHSGTLLTQNTSATPISTGKTWGGLVNYNSAATAQTAMAGTYNNLTITPTGGATASGDITVNGILSLPAANPSTTKGSLELVTNWNSYPSADNAVPGSITTYTLYMGASATTTGIGDVTGIVTRNTIAANTSYSFGNQYTTISITQGTSPTLPSAISVIIKIGIAPAGKADAVKRHYQILPTGGANCYVSANFYYLDAELNSNTEANLVTWDYDLDGGFPTPDEHGRAAYDFTNNYVGMSNIPIDYFIYVDPGHAWRTIFELGVRGAAKYLTWTGGTSTSWTETLNWLPSGNTPDLTCFIIIPDAATTPNDPILPATAEVNTLLIQNGGILVMGSSTLTIKNSLSGGWEDQNPTGNDPGTSTVIFANAGATLSGTCNFYDVQIATGASVTNAENSIIKIGNSITKSGTGTWYADVAGGTVEYYKAGDQTVLMTDGLPNYHNLTLSGSGTKTLPASDLTLDKDLNLSGTVIVAPTNAITMGGNFTLGSGTTFTAGSLTHNIGGNWINNGCTFTNTGSNINFNGTAAQEIRGTSETTFNDLSISNSLGVTIENSTGTTQTVTGQLIFNSGLITTGAKTLVLGSNSPCSSGSVSGAGAGKYVNGNLRRYIPDGTDQTITYYIGDATTYAPVSIEFTGTTSACGYLDASTTAIGSAPAVPSGLSQTRYLSRKWTITNTDVAGFTSYSPTFVFAPSDIVGGANTNNFIVKKLDTGVWSNTTSGTKTSTSIQCTGLTSFSDFYIGESNVSTVLINDNVHSR